MTWKGSACCPPSLGLRDGNYDELYLSEATWEVKRAIRTARWKLIDSIEQDPHGRPMQELFDLQADPREQHNVIDEYPDSGGSLLAAPPCLGRAAPARDRPHGRSAARARGSAPRAIGDAEARRDSWAPGRPRCTNGAAARAADIPAPGELKAPNEAPDR